MSAQREVRLLCLHEVGWSYVLLLHWEKSSMAFLQLKNESRWSKSFYCYLSAGLYQIFLEIFYLVQTLKPITRVSFINTSYLTDSYIVFTLKMESVSKKYNFWPKNDGEKWSRKIYFEIPPCRKPFHLLHKREDFCTK